MANCRSKAGVFSVIPVVLLSACNAGDEITQVSTASLTEIALPLPLRSVSALDPSSLQLQVIVNDLATTLEREEDDIWRGSVDVPVNQTSRVAVEWGVDYGTTGYLKLAAQQRFVFVGAEERTVIFTSNYDTDFDSDRDTRTNFAEFAQNRSPVNNLDVTINVDGTYATGGVTYPFSDVCGQKLPIGILTSGEASDNESWWCATLETELTDADGNAQEIEHLKITVNVVDEQLFTDSGTSASSVSYHDDSVEIFIDGDDNKRGSYDGLNDFQFRFGPLGDGVFSTERGPYEPANLNASFEYFNGGYTLTAIIPLDEVGIQNGFPFGINVDVNDDDNGGNRDAKYSWVATEGEDISWFNTAAFGTSQVP